MRAATMSDIRLAIKKYLDDLDQGLVKRSERPTALQHGLLKETLSTIERLTRERDDLLFLVKYYRNKWMLAVGLRNKDAKDHE